MYQVQFIITPREKSAMTEKLFSLGAGSVSVRRGETGELLLVALFADTAPVSAAFAGGYEIRELPDEEWKYAWMRGYKGFPLNERVYIHPANSETPAPAGYEVVISLDPRDAFGDGRHATTALCLSSLEKAIDDIPPGERERLRLIDVGTGTGILATYAALRGVGYVKGIDTEEDAVLRARENARRNGIDGAVFELADIEVYEDPLRYDIVMANLLTGIITRSLPRIGSLIGAGGRCIISGISSLWALEMEELFTRNGYRVAAHDERENWHCFTVIPVFYS